MVVVHVVLTDDDLQCCTSALSFASNPSHFWKIGFSTHVATFQIIVFASRAIPFPLTCFTQVHRMGHQTIPLLGS